MLAALLLYFSFIGTSSAFSTVCKNTAKFYLYNNLTGPGGVECNETNCDSYILPDSNVTVLCHGFNGSHTGLPASILTQEYVRRNHNVVVPDYSELVADPFFNYPIAMSNTYPIANCVRSFLLWLWGRKGLSASRTTIIGHSLGAHVAGLVGKGANFTLQLIVGLDPAGPFYLPVGDDIRGLMKGDAAKVCVVHTNCNCFGTFKTLGDTDVYLNDCKIQPGCQGTGSNPICVLDKRNLCSHFQVNTIWRRVLTGEQLLAKSVQCPFNIALLGQVCRVASSPRTVLLTETCSGMSKKDQEMVEALLFQCSHLPVCCEQSELKDMRHWNGCSHTTFSDPYYPFVYFKIAPKTC